MKKGIVTWAELILANRTPGGDVDCMGCLQPFLIFPESAAGCRELGQYRLRFLEQPCNST